VSIRQGAVVLPLLANVYLHYVFDLWVEAWRKKVATGDVIVVRYADDLVVGFQHWTDAARFLREFGEQSSVWNYMRTRHDWSGSGGSPLKTESSAARGDRRPLRFWVSSIAFLIDRYKLVVHYEDRPTDAYTLVAAKPKLTKANPENRTGCIRQTGAKPGLMCQNITMAQFAEQVQAYDNDILYRVMDGTGIEGAWDFTLSYNPFANLAPLLAEMRDRAATRAGAAAPAPSAEPSEPSGSVSFADAIEKQLGLKLEKQKRPEPVLVIDHIEQKPTDNWGY
jgi:hypothetical protein